LPQRLVKLQIWLWFVGMMVLSMPWHLVGLLGMPRRMAYYDYTHPDIAPQAWTVVASTLGGLLLVISAFILVYILAAAHRRPKSTPAPFTFSAAAHPGGRTPAVLNGFGLWVAMMIGLTLVNYGFPIAQLAVLKDASVPVIPIGSR
jgi:cytochrome c oxidase subunit 1